MANHPSALKHERQSVRRRARNRANLSQLKTRLKKLRTAIAAGDVATARQLLPATVAEIDRAAKKGVVHGNAADRYKSRLSRKISALAVKA